MKKLFSGNNFFENISRAGISKINISAALKRPIRENIKNFLE